MHRSLFSWSVLLIWQSLYKHHSTFSFEHALFLRKGFAHRPAFLGGQERARIGCRAACLIAVAAAGSCPDVPPGFMLPTGAAVIGSLDLCAVRALPGEVLIGERPSTRWAQNIHRLVTFKVVAAYAGPVLLTPCVLSPFADEYSVQIPLVQLLVLWPARAPGMVKFVLSEAHQTCACRNR